MRQELGLQVVGDLARSIHVGMVGLADELRAARAADQGEVATLIAGFLSINASSSQSDSSAWNKKK
jgi:hypothetical protein